MPKFPRSQRTSRLRRALSVPNVLATIAVAASLTGTAYAAIIVTGKNVRDSTLQGRDFKNATLAATDFSYATRTALRVKGSPGATGPQGAEGPQGSKGTTGDTGVPAPRAYTFQTSAQAGRVGGAKPNPHGSEIIPSCAEAAGFGDTMIGCPGAPVMFPRWDYWCAYQAYDRTRHCNTTTLSVPQLTRSNRTVMVTSENASGGLLTMPWEGTIALHATATFYTQRSSSRQRLECQLQIAQVENGSQLPAENVGAPITQYRHIDPTDIDTKQRLLNISVTGAIARPAGVYETQLVCRAPDDNGNPGDRLEFIEGNMSVFSTRSNGLA